MLYTMQNFLVLAGAFVAIAIIVSRIINKKRSWKNFKLLDGEKVEYEKLKRKAEMAEDLKKEILNFLQNQRLKIK